MVLKVRQWVSLAAFAVITPKHAPLLRRARLRGPRGQSQLAGFQRRLWLQAQKQTRPSGLKSDPPGPAMPVTETVSVAFECFSAPAAISAATCSDTAPWVSNVSAETPNISILAALEYVTNPRSKTRELPAISVIAAEIIPPVQLSAVDITMPVALARFTMSFARLTSIPHVKLRPV